jgi:hypothetical protein
VSPPREIACDESGYEGENLVGGETDVFAHAGVHMAATSAARCITELRRRIRSPALEYKANHLLREKHRPVLVWLLGPGGPLGGHAHVHLVDKTFFLVRRTVALLAAGVADDRAEAMARILYRAGRQALEPGRWASFLVSSNDLMRTRNRQAGPPEGPESFRRAVELLRPGVPGEAAEVLQLLGQARSHALLGAPDLLVPAIVRAVSYWSDGGTVPVALVHDRQTALTDARISRLMARCGGPAGPLTDVRLVDSRTDPRVQIADFLAGVARKVASYELAGRGDAELVALLRPYVDPSSVWGDDRSWSMLAPTAGAC